MPPTTSTPRSSARSRFGLSAGIAVEAVLREGHELEREVGGDPPPDLQQRLHPDQPLVADIDVADGADPLRHRHVAIGERPFDHGLDGEQRLEFVPELDALQQCPGTVQPRQPERERRVHVEMAVDERRRHEPA